MSAPYDGASTVRDFCVKLIKDYTSELIENERIDSLAMDSTGKKLPF